MSVAIEAPVLASVCDKPEGGSTFQVGDSTRYVPKEYFDRFGTIPLRSICKRRLPMAVLIVLTEYDAAG